MTTLHMERDPANAMCVISSLDKYSNSHMTTHIGKRPYKCYVGESPAYKI